MAVRFAPSPTGELHLGHAYSALLNWHHAQETGVPFLLRHEDIDATRVRPHFYDWIEEDLAWLGLDWPKPVRRQSDHIDDYRDRLVALAEMGVVYPCAKTRKDVALAADSAPQAGHEGAAPLLDRPSDQNIADTLGSGVSFAWRFDPRVAKDLVGSKSLTMNMALGIRMLIPSGLAVWCWGARMQRPATTSAWFMTTRCKTSVPLFGVKIWPIARTFMWSYKHC
jgi:tRNA synthetases class I (E and Q), catalytic domain